MTKKNIEFLINVFFVGLSITFIVLIVGMRPLDAGNDTPLYINVFNEIKTVSSSYEVGVSIFGSKEPFFWLYTGIFKLFSDNPQVWLTANILLVSLLILYFCINLSRHYQIKLWGVTFFLIFLTYEIVFLGGAMRQAFAIPFVSLYLLYSYQNKYFKAIILLFVAALFHFSSLLFFPFLIFSRYHMFLSNRYLTLFFISAVILSIFFIPISNLIIHLISFQPLIEKYNLYIASNFEGEMVNRSVLSSINMLFGFFTILLVLFHFNKREFLYQTSLYFLLLFILFLNFPVIEVRILAYYMIFYPFIFFKIIKTYTNKSTYAYVLLSILFYCIALSTFLRKSAQYTLGYELW